MLATLFLTLTTLANGLQACSVAFVAHVKLFYELFERSSAYTLLEKKNRVGQCRHSPFLPGQKVPLKLL